MMFNLRSLDKLSLKLILSILFIGIIYFVYSKSQLLGTNESFAPTAESVSQCAESARVMKQAIDDNVSDNKQSFDNATAAWTQKKTDAQNAFNSSPSLWASMCTGTRCEPTSSFFNDFAGAVYNGHDLSGGYQNGLDEEQCKRNCRSRNDCQFYTWRDGNCWMKGATHINSNFTSGFRGKNGYTTIDNRQMWGNDFYQFNSGSAQGCENACSSNADCMLYTYEKNSGGCWLKGSPGRNTGHNSGVKEPKVDFNLDNNDPYIIAKAGAQPQEKDYKTALNLPALVCQDCRQQISDVSATDSQATLNQTNQCIANLERQVAAAPSPPSSLNPAPITPTPGATSYSLPGMIPAESSTVPVKRNYTPIYIGGGLTSCIFMCVCVLILAAIGYMVMSGKD